MKKIYVLAAVLFLGATAMASAHSYTLGAIEIGHINAKLLDGGDVAVYGPLLNAGKESDTLVAVASPWAARARFHEKNDKGETWPDTIELAPGKPFALAPWHAHIVLSGLKRAVHDGDKIPLTLTFAHAGEVKVEALAEQESSH